MLPDRISKVRSQATGWRGRSSVIRNLGSSSWRAPRICVSGPRAWGSLSFTFLAIFTVRVKYDFEAPAVKWSRGSLGRRVVDLLVLGSLPAWVRALSSEGDERIDLLVFHLAWRFVVSA